MVTTKDIRATFQRGAQLVLLAFPQFIGAIASFVVAIGYAQSMPQAEYGLYLLIATSPALIFALAELGVGQVALKYGAQTSEQEPGQLVVVASYTLAFRFRMGLVLTVAAPIVAFAFSYLYGHPKTLILFLFSVVIGAWSNVFTGSLTFLQIRRQFKAYSTLRVLLLAPAPLALVASLVTGNWTLDFVVTVNLVIQLGFSGLVHSLALNGLLDAKAQRSLLVTRKLPALPVPKENLDGQNSVTSSRLFAAIAITSAISTQIETVVIGSLLTSVDAAIYGVAQKLTSPILMVITALGTLLWANAYRHQNHHEVVRSIRTNTVMTFLIASTLVLYVLAAPAVVTWFFPSSYLASIWLFDLMAIRYVMVVALLPLYIFSNALGFQRVGLVVSLANLAIYIYCAISYVTRLGVPFLLVANIALELVVAVATLAFVIIKVRGAKA